MPRLHSTSGHGIERDIRQAEVIGIAALLAAQPCTIAQLLSEITLFNAFHQALVLRDALGRPDCIVTWAYLSPRTIERMHLDASYQLHASELNEGDTLCFSGICPQPGALLPRVRAHAASLALDGAGYYVTDRFFGRRTLFEQGSGFAAVAGAKEHHHA